MDASNNWGRLFHYVGQAWSGQRSVTLPQAAAIPYATIGVRFGDNPEGILVLATGDNGNYIWTSVSHVAIETRDGRIIRTSGIGKDLSGLLFRTTDPIVTHEHGENIRIMDFQDMNLFGLPVRCNISDRGSRTLEILGQPIVTRQTDESCRSEILNWAFTNSFWTDSSGTVWKSVQHIHPDSLPITIEVLRPPG